MQLGYTPFRFEPKIPIDADGDGVPESLGYSVEPSCLAPAKDDGQIGFTGTGIDTHVERSHQMIIGQIGIGGKIISITIP